MLLFRIKRKYDGQVELSSPNDIRSIYESLCISTVCEVEFCSKVLTSLLLVSCTSGCSSKNFETGSSL